MAESPQEIEFKVRLAMDKGPTPVDLAAAQSLVYDYAGLGAVPLQPSLDVLCLAFAALAKQMAEANAAFADFVTGYQTKLREIDAVLAREHKEHEPTSGRLYFTPGLPVKGALAFTD